MRWQPDRIRLSRDHRVPLHTSAADIAPISAPPLFLTQHVVLCFTLATAWTIFAWTHGQGLLMGISFEVAIRKRKQVLLTFAPQWGFAVCSCPRAACFHFATLRPPESCLLETSKQPHRWCLHQPGFSTQMLQSSEKSSGCYHL